MAALLAELAEPRTRELDALARDPAAEARERGEREARLGDAVARCVPRHVDRAEAEPAGDRVPHLATFRAERGGGAGGAEELHDREPRACGAQSLDMPCELREPHGRLGAERDRHGGLG